MSLVIKVLGLLNFMQLKKNSVNYNLINFPEEKLKLFIFTLFIYLDYFSHMIFLVSD